MTKFMTIASCLSLGLIAITGAGVGINASNNNGLVGLKATANSYVCGDVTFGETVGNPSSSTDLTTKTNIDKVCTYTTLVAGTSFTLTSWTNANYQNKSTEGVYYAVKIGGSKASKYSGSFNLNLTGYTCERAIVYATGWTGDSNTAISINSSKEQTVTTTTSGNYSFSAYTFEEINSSTLTINNKAGLTGKGRIVISKIILRLKAVTA